MGERLGDDIVVDVDMGAVWLRSIDCVGLDLRECTLQKDKGGAIDVCICNARNEEEKKKNGEDREVCHTLVRGKARRGQAQEEVGTFNWCCWVVVARRTCSPTWCVRA